MPYKSKRCDPRPKARDVPFSWARASAYRNRAIEYLKLAHLAPDRNVRKRFIAIGRRYCTLAEFERRTAAEPASYSHQSQNTVDRNHSGPFTSFAFVLMIIVSGTTTTVPFDLARASDCLAAPNSPAPKGSHWYHHLETEKLSKSVGTRARLKNSLSVRRHKQVRVTLPCLQQAQGRLVQPRLMILMDPRAKANRLPRQYRIPLPTRYQTDRRPRLLHEKIRATRFTGKQLIRHWRSGRTDRGGMARSAADGSSNQRTRG